MKRSKVINFISNFLYEHNLEPWEADQEAVFLLDKLEEMGMKPPNNPNIEHPEQGIMEHQWEPEDENPTE